MRFNLSTYSEEQLIEHLGEEWEAIQGSLDALNLWIAIVTTQNAVSTGNNDMDRIKMRRHLMLEMLRRGPNETPLMFQDSLKKALDAMEQLGDDTENTDVTLSQAYLATRNITILNPARHTTFLVELESRVAKEMTGTQRHFWMRTTWCKSGRQHDPDQLNLKPIRSLCCSKSWRT